MGITEVETVIDIRGDVCSASTKVGVGGFQFGALEARWGYGSVHDGKRYELHLCESCFFQTVAYLKQERQTQHMFSTDAPAQPDDFGLVVKDDYFGDSSR